MRLRRLGFVALMDCAPLAMAQELGLFRKYGLKVALQRELGWASIRDKVIYGELEAAHALDRLREASRQLIEHCKSSRYGGLEPEFLQPSTRAAAPAERRGCRAVAGCRPLP